MGNIKKAVLFIDFLLSVWFWLTMSKCFVGIDSANLNNA